MPIPETGTSAAPPPVILTEFRHDSMARVRPTNLKPFMCSENCVAGRTGWIARAPGVHQNTEEFVPHDHLQSNRAIGPRSGHLVRRNYEGQQGRRSRATESWRKIRDRMTRIHPGHQRLRKRGKSRAGQSRIPQVRLRCLPPCETNWQDDPIDDRDGRVHPGRPLALVCPSLQDPHTMRSSSECWKGPGWWDANSKAVSSSCSRRRSYGRCRSRCPRP